MMCCLRRASALQSRNYFFYAGWNASVQTLVRHDSVGLHSRVTSRTAVPVLLHPAQAFARRSDASTIHCRDAEQRSTLRADGG